jgi:hypothetical protein
MYCSPTKYLADKTIVYLCINHHLLPLLPPRVQSPLQLFRALHSARERPILGITTGAPSAALRLRQRGWFATRVRETKSQRNQGSGCGTLISSESYTRILRGCLAWADRGCWVVSVGLCDLYLSLYEKNVLLSLELTTGHRLIGIDEMSVYQYPLFGSKRQTLKKDSNPKHRQISLYIPCEFL